jgi:hypothetical protein
MFVTTEATETSSHTAIEKLPLGWDFERYVLQRILLDRYTGLEKSAFTVEFTAACR